LKRIIAVKERIIGNEGKILENEARKLFDNWRPIREEVIERVRRGEKEIAAGITIGKGASHVALLEEKMLGLTTYARQKAADFMHETEKVQSRLNLALVIFLLLGILASVLVAFFTIRRTASSEKALQESEERYRSLVENQTDLVCRFTPDGTLIYVNDAYCHFSEKTKDELIGKKWHPLPVSDDVPFIQEKLLTLSPSNPTVIIENRIFSGKGDIHWMQFSNTAFFDHQGDLLEIQSVGRDITERKRAEVEVKSANSFLDTIVDMSPFSMWVSDRKGTVIKTNRSLRETLNLEDGKIVGEYNVLKDENLERQGVMPMVRAVFGNHEPARFSIPWNAAEAGDVDFGGGRDLYIDVSMFPILNTEGELTNVVCQWVDITDQKEAEKALQESEKRYRALFENMSDGVAIYEAKDEGEDFIFVDFNKAGEKIDKVHKEALIGKSVLEMFPAVKDFGLIELFQRVWKTGEPEHHPMAIYEDERITGWRTNFVYKLASGEIVAIYSDETHRKRAEEALRESEEKFRGLAENNFDMIFATDKEGYITYVSPAAERIFGFKPEEMAGNHFMGYLAKSEIPRVSQAFAGAIQGTGFGTITMEVLRKDGGNAYIELIASIISREDKVVGTQGVIRDVTEKKRLQDKLQRAQKMEAMGLMAGGVAHDLNNILSGIVSYPELLLMDLPEDSPLTEPLKTIKESGMRAVDVVADLLTIARGVAAGKEISNLNALIKGYLNSAEHQKLAETYPFIAFKTDIDSDLLNISCSPTHIKKILMNLITNASEAIEGSGTVAISTLNRYLDAPLKGYQDVSTGEYVMLTVSDDGSGISTGDLERIFEPFYTKKMMGRSGTGLGLAVVWNTVQDHKGYINVKSSERGTTFELYFPVTREEVAAEKEEVPLEDYLGHGEKILVVDDEERQREIASGILTRLGYNAEAVSSGEEAVEYVKEHSVDLIVLDMVMPKGINGRETYKEIIKIRPGQKAIIASGYAKTKEMDTAQELGAGKYIKKPYTLEKVGLAVKEELEK